MHAYCTYCSASKDPSTGLVPAYRRYISDRIIRVQQLAETEKVHFCILSGKFGLVDWNEPLPWYDHLLTLDEAPQLVEVVARQLVEKGIDQLHFFANSPRARISNSGPTSKLLNKHAPRQAFRLRVLLLLNRLFPQRL